MSPLKLQSNIKRLAKERSLSIIKLEELAGLKRDTIKNWDLHFPSVDKVQKVANVLDVSIDYLVGNTENPFSHKDCFSPVVSILVHAAEKERINLEEATSIAEMIGVFRRNKRK